MIQASVSFALKNRFLVLCAGILLLIWGGISFKALPVEAYPDVANNYVQVITQWPGRAAEEVEQQVTIPIEVQMNGLPQLAALRSTSLAGLSSVMMVFEDGSVNDLNRQKVLERLSQVNLPNGLQPSIGSDYSPVGQIYFFTLKSSNPDYDVMELKSLQDWVLVKQLKSVKDVIDVVVFGGATREYQVQVDPNKLISYGLNIGQVEQALSNNNVNAGGSFIERGSQAINVRAVGLMGSTTDIGSAFLKAQGGIPVRVRDVAIVAQGPKIRLGQLGKAVHDAGKVIDDPDVVSGIVLLRKGADSDAVLQELHDKVDFLNHHFLPPGVTIVPHLDRSDLVHLTTHTVLHNLTEGIILVSVILFIFLGNIRGALIVTLTIPFALLFASACLYTEHIPANLLSLGALDFGMIVEGAVVMIENIVRLLSHPGITPEETVAEKIKRAAHEVQRPVFYSIIIIITAYVPIFTLQRVEGRLFRPMAWTVAFALLGALLFSMFLGPVIASLVYPKGTKEWRNPLMTLLTRLYGSTLNLAIRWRWVTAGASVAMLVGTYFLASTIGSEFLPHLDEGAVWARGTLAPSMGPTEGIRITNEARKMFAYVEALAGRFEAELTPLHVIEPPTYNSTLAELEEVPLRRFDDLFGKDLKYLRVERLIEHGDAAVKIVECAVTRNADLIMILLRFLILPRTALIAENLFLRKQLALFKERKARHRRTTRGLRLAMVALARFFEWRDALVIVQPETLLKWHRTAFRMFWLWKSRKPGRPPLPRNLQDLIREMDRENPCWGEERITAELKLKLGIDVSPRTVRKYLDSDRPPRRGSGQKWSTFVRNHAKAIVACDFLISITADFRVLYVFVAMEIGSRRILHCNVTQHPTAEWTTQQFREFLAFDHPYRLLIHDRDAIFSAHVDAALKDFGVRALKTPVRTPTANAFCERLVGTIRRECLDFLIPINEHHLRRILTEFMIHYNRGRPHSSLGPGIPEPLQDKVPDSGHRHKLPTGYRVKSRPVLGGLHHDYSLEKEAA